MGEPDWQRLCQFRAHARRHVPRADRPARHERPDPVIEHPQDIILRVVRTAICGSDLHLYRGLVPDTRVGHVFGHEFSGVVEEVGAGVTKLRRGDRVVVPFNIACGECFWCRRGEFSACDNSNANSALLGGVYGYSHTAGGYDGGQAEYVRVPFADVGPMPIPDDMTDEQTLLLSDVLPTGWQAAEMGDIQPGETVAVFGCGPVGLFAQKSAWLQGAGRVIALDRVADRLAFARTYAGSEVVDLNATDDPVQTLREMTEGRGPDIAIDAVGLEADGSRMHDLLGRVLMMQAGSAVTIGWAIDAVRRAGRVVVIGVYGPPWNLVPVGSAMNKGLSIRAGQANVRRSMEPLLSRIRAGEIDAAAMISHRLPLTDAPHAYEQFARKAVGFRKVVLLPPSELAA
jgi:threonine dehydrogenase-like Zn-dependent dehydrogenase